MGAAAEPFDSSSDCALKRWAEQMVHNKGPKRARVAVACKLSMVLLSLWRNQTDFRWA